MLKLNAFSLPDKFINSINFADTPLASNEPVKINNAAKKTNISQSKAEKTFSGFTRRVMSSAQAAIKAAKAMDTPAKKAINIAAVIISVFTNKGR